MNSLKHFSCSFLLGTHVTNFPDKKKVRPIWVVLVVCWNMLLW